MDAEASSRVVFVCDAGQSVGVGHVMRSLALAEELLSRGAAVAMIANLGDVPWARSEVVSRGIAVVDRPDDSSLLDEIAAASPTAVVFDGYTLPSSVLQSARSRWHTLVMVDGDSGSPVGSIVVDQNVGAPDRPEIAGVSRALTGPRYALIRDDVLSHRPTAPPILLPSTALPRVLVVMGGTDAHNVTPLVLAALSASGVACRIRAVTRQSASDVAPAGMAPEQTLQVVEPGSAYAAWVAHSDLVISAAGSSVWEMLALGSCAALVLVAENQECGYRGAVERDLVVGLGDADELRCDAGLRVVVSRLQSLLRQPHERNAYASRAWHAVDGRGRERVADQLLGLR